MLTVRAIIYSLSLFILVACGSKGSDIGSDGSPQDQVFNFKTVQSTQVKVLTDHPRVVFKVLDAGKRLMAEVTTDDEGCFVIDIPVSMTSQSIYITTDQIGVVSEAHIVLDQHMVELDLRGGNVVANNDFFEEKLDVLSLDTELSMLSNFPNYSTLGSWSRWGVPSYLTSPVVISKDFYEFVNKALPNYKPVPEYRPHYLDDSLDKDIHVVEEGEVFVTFIHEGAGYKNTLGFYTYPTVDGPPETINPEDIHIIFPNVSYKGSGGGLLTGDTVNIGKFTPGTSIGWVLVSNAYSTRFRGVSGGINTFYSHDVLNPDKAPYQQHFVQLHYEDQVVLGVEDLVRPGGDNDFNDAVFTITSNPAGAIDKSKMVTNFDENYGNKQEEEKHDKKENNEEKNGYQYFPGKEEFATLAFEDLWPHKGDYDFNDLVIDYNITETLNKQNEIIELSMKVRVVGLLASMHNGFGLQLGVRPELVASVTGYKHTKGYTKLYENGTEQRQDRAVIIVLEDAWDHFNVKNPDESELIEVVVKFTEGVTRKQLGQAPYNPFIMSNGERGREVHLPGYQPTSLVHYDYFGSNDDDSAIGTTYTYKTSDDLPWAIHLPEKFAYPYDSVKVYDAYTVFTEWVKSEGSTYNDWYQDKPNYRIPKYILRYW